MDTTTGAQKDPLYYLYDGLGSVVQLTDSTGKTADKYAFDEFGNQVAGGKQSPNATNVLHNNFGYAGEQWDAEAGLQYLRNRYYDPEIGRFINRDNVMGDAFAPLTQNLYAYVSNNPINFVDPSGHYRAGLTPGTDDWFDDIENGRWTPDQVKQLQRDLNAWGFTGDVSRLQESGVYDKATKTAHRMYFKARNDFINKGGTLAKWEENLRNGIYDPNPQQNSVTNNNPSLPKCSVDTGSGIKSASREKIIKEALDSPLGKNNPLAMYMLLNSLQDNPKDLSYFNDTFVTNKIKSTKAYNVLINNLISNANSNGSTYFSVNTSMNFEQNDSMDLFLALHAVNVEVTGVRYQDGSWGIKTYIKDNYDYTKILKEFNKPALFNNIAVIMQGVGVIVPYNVEISFQDYK